MNFTGLLDMIDGGGAGAAGSEFVGGPLSEFLNAMGVRPRGYNDRQQGMQGTRPQTRPGMPMAPQPMPEVMRTGNVGSTPYSPPPQGNLTPGSMTLPNLGTMGEMGRAMRGAQDFEMYGTAPQPDPYQQVYGLLSQSNTAEADQLRNYLAAYGIIPGAFGGGR